MNHSEKVARAWVEEVEAAAIECHRLARRYASECPDTYLDKLQGIARDQVNNELRKFANDEFYFVIRSVPRYREAFEYLEAAWLASYYSARLQSWAVEFIEEAAN